MPTTRRFLTTPWMDIRQLMGTTSLAPSEDGDRVRDGRLAGSGKYISPHLPLFNQDFVLDTKISYRRIEIMENGLLGYRQYRQHHQQHQQQHRQQHRQHHRQHHHHSFASTLDCSTTLMENPKKSGRPTLFAIQLIGWESSTKIIQQGSKSVMKVLFCVCGCGFGFGFGCWMAGFGFDFFLVYGQGWARVHSINVLRSR